MGGPFSAILIQIIRKNFILLFQTIADTRQGYGYANICK